MVRLNDDKEMVRSIKEGLKRTGGYCPCRIEKTPDTKCPCKEFRTETKVGETCHCGLYVKTEM